MLARGDWLVLTRAGELYSDKPPLFVWLEAVLLWVTDSIRAAHQLPGLIAAALVLLLTYDLGRRLWSPRIGRWAVLVLLSMIQFVLQARSGQIDAVLCVFTTLGLYGIVRATLLGPSLPCWILAFVAVALGVMTKGVGFLPLLVLIPWLALRHTRSRRGDASTPGTGLGLGHRWIWGPVAMLAVIAAWFLPLLLRAAQADDPALGAYVEDLLLGQTVERYAQPSGHFRPPWYFLGVVAWAWFPVTPLLAWIAPAWWRRLRRGDPRYLLLLGWVALVVLFFSLSAGKRGVYVLPVIPAVALAVAPLAAGLLRLPAVRATCFALGLALAGVVGATALSFSSHPETAIAELTWPLASFSVVLLGLVVAAGRRRGPATLIACLCLMWATYGLAIYPRIDPLRSGRVLMSVVEDRLGGEELSIVDWREQMVLHSRRPITHFGYHTPVERQTAAAAAWLREAPETRKALVPARDLAPCFAPRSPPLIETRRRLWHLVSARDLTPGCRPEPLVAIVARPGRG